MNKQLESEVEKKKLRDKIFAERKSLLTELLEVKHFKTIRHIFVALLLGFLCNDVISVLFNTGEVNFGLRMIKIGFAKFHIVILLWMLIFSANLSTYVGFKLWAEVRQNLSPKSALNKWWDKLWLTIIISYYLGSLCIVPVMVIKLDLPCASSVIVVIEQVRLLMKSHAFIRSNAPNILHYKPHADTVLVLPHFSKYIYFSFAPTLIYRDEYPRTKQVNWKYATMCFAEVLVIIWLQSFVFEKYFARKFEQTGQIPLNWSITLLSMFENALPSVLVLVFEFYLILHVWQNGFAEILKFADRKFYEDWWTATNYATYFRTWNVVVHDWLFLYIYKDMYEHVTPKNKVVPKLMVFFVSAIIHEYVLSFMLRVFFPVLFVNFFLFGTLFSFVHPKHSVFNALFLYSVALGNSIQMCLYTMEYYARGNCPVEVRNVTSHLTPRITTTDCIFGL